jgi:hypothetical protein
MNELKVTLQSLVDWDNAKLRATWRRLHRGEPPASMSRDVLTRAIAYTLQVKAEGGLSQGTQRALRTWRGPDVGGATHPDAVLTLKPGVRLIREWGGRTHQVMVTDDGFDYDGKRYRSLSEIARAITGARWSGPRFFGVRKRQGQRFEPGASVDA